MKIIVPPIKSQGIKTKLVPFIGENIPSEFNGTWIEPFMGTGVVGFNLAIKKAILCDNNPHLINFYQAIQNQEISSEIAKSYLIDEGEKLLKKGESHYYYIRDRFNEKGNSLDFLFLNRACFNGMMRFNKKGGFNVPFCRKPNRFAQAYITKITNQIKHIEQILSTKEIIFLCQDFRQTIAMAKKDDLIYCDPPYIDRYADYFNNWQENDEYDLYELLSNSQADFLLSTWHHNKYRSNIYIDKLWGEFGIVNQSHFYHVGASESNRNAMTESLVSRIG
ncbi:Dam family site-specific DNA-(adenine-N6)-methyltransferase [Moraxella catarrhalis]|uniref:Site-specific DNA-methyltransferase (adenine-specific) n=1 Tax=Moraxella catarrhalis TaxID=480 RepID=A0A198UI72_MORCA|nr:Dam family site-specific DNA-(adenine-N6)-methyltransferase [Moraxella catarrhalis]OAU96091.1 Modification methylase EcoRV Adenine-specific methyltransferase EcoRV M.EcoRV [Moraxella catarrhalis]OAU96620.1 Modification methylase EcoRV Adenine-specific methyltransferase EcoRV M.EcoRV [Moraxella catarrhalis]OAV00487.1 Modification methylase EcoRV Adenine-specific methyltransferase EcoRV M.EcoRV [Moraxella catarrhalis]